MLIFNIQLQRKFETDKYLQSTRKNQARNYELIIIKKAVSWIKNFTQEVYTASLLKHFTFVDRDNSGKLVKTLVRSGLVKTRQKLNTMASSQTFRKRKRNAAWINVNSKLKRKLIFLDFKWEKYN